MLAAKCSMKFSLSLFLFCAFINFASAAQLSLTTYNSSLPDTPRTLTIDFSLVPQGGGNYKFVSTQSQTPSSGVGTAAQTTFQFRRNGTYLVGPVTDEQGTYYVGDGFLGSPTTLGRDHTDYQSTTISLPSGCDGVMVVMAGSSLGYPKRKSVWLPVSPIPSSLQSSFSPPESQHVGNTWSGTVTGAPLGYGYTFSATGSVSVTGDYDTGYFVITAEACDVGTVTVTADSSPCHLEPTPLVLEFDISGTEQVCSVTQNGTVIKNGEYITGSSSGAGETGNSYNIRVISGPVSASINSTTGAFTIFGNGIGEYVVGVWISEGNCYERSNEANPSGSVIVSTRNKATVTLDNKGHDTPTTFKVYQDGNLLQTYVVPAGESLITSLTTPTTGRLTITSVTSDLVKNGPVWSFEPGSDPVETLVGEVDPQQLPEDSDDPPSQGEYTPNRPNDNTPDPDTQDVSHTINSENANEGLTALQFGEGISKINANFRGTQSLGTLPTPTVPASSSNIQTLQERVNSLPSKIPDPPQIIAPTGISTQFNGPSFALAGRNYDMSYDLAPYSPQVAIFRAIAQGVLSILFFFVYAKTIRSAFAG